MCTYCSLLLKDPVQTSETGKRYCKECFDIVRYLRGSVGTVYKATYKRRVLGYVSRTLFSCFGDGNEKSVVNKPNFNTNKAMVNYILM